MTIKSYKKILKQVAHKDAKRKKILKHNKPKDRSTGRTKTKCTRCGKFSSHIHKYGLHLCRQCFREMADELGFKKYGHEV